MPQALKRFFDAVQALNRDGLLLAYHDRSDGGLVRDAVRDGVRRPHCGVTSTSTCSLRRARARRRRQRAASGAMAADRIACSRRCSPRSWARCCRSAPQDRSARARAAARGRTCTRSRSAARTTSDEIRLMRNAQAGVRRDAHRRCSAPGPRPPAACRRCATIRSARARNTTASSTPSDPGLHAQLSFDPARGRRRAVTSPRARGRGSRSCASRA